MFELLLPTFTFGMQAFLLPARCRQIICLPPPSLYLTLPLLTPFLLQAKPSIYVTYNGDFFDFPFIQKRASVHGMDLYEQLGFRCGHVLLARPHKPHQAGS